ncbi:MAG: CpsD/CapB family tyrosine-protein kinase [Gemmobacter sp.]
MERIQSAIAKARAERSNPIPAASLPMPEQPAVEKTLPAGPFFAQSATDSHWVALAPFVPDPARLARQRIVTVAGGRDAVPFDVMRTRFLQQIRQNKWRRVAITSPTAACGKTTIALNLAFGLARQPTLRTILCELDLRRPTISAVLGLRDMLSFAQVIEGQAPFADHARRIGGNLAVALNRSATRNPSEILQSATVSDALAGIEETYAPDVMLFDLPPMLVSDDAMAFVGQVDAVLLVAAAEATSIKQIDTCERDLAAQTNVMGVILNKCRYTGPDHGYDYD